MKRQWVVAHCGCRDSYQLPIAMHESGQLHRFVTDWYSPFDNPLVGGLLEYAPRGVRSRLSQRYRKDLPSKLVKDMKLRGMLYSVLKTNVLDSYMNRAVGESAARAASDSGSHLLITSYYGWAAFQMLSTNARKVLFQVHPHPWFLRDLYRRQQHEEGDDCNFDSELEMRVTDEFLRRWGQESLNADLVIAASSFTRKSLICAGVRAEKILIVPYGVDSQVFRDDVDVPSGRTKALFLGQATSRKGFHHLLRVWDRVSNMGAELHIVSAGTRRTQESNSAGPIIWHDRLVLKDLVALLNSVDLLVLPSIAEGFGQVLLEALSCGTPILCSDATAGPDLLIDWEQGFIFPSCDWEGLAACLDYWLTNVDHLRRLRKPAKRLAESRTWARFRQGVRNACDQALEHDM